MLLRLDRKGILRFAPLQSPTAQRYLQAHGLPTADFDSLVFVPDWTRQAEAEFLLRTDGALAAARAVGGMGTAMAWLRILPRSWRDLAYKAISRWRYRIFGEWKSAPLSQGEWAARFLA